MSKISEQVEALERHAVMATDENNQLREQVKELEKQLLTLEGRYQTKVQILDALAARLLPPPNSCSWNHDKLLPALDYILTKLSTPPQVSDEHKQLQDAYWKVNRVLASVCDLRNSLPQPKL